MPLSRVAPRHAAPALPPPSASVEAHPSTPRATDAPLRSRGRSAAWAVLIAALALGLPVSLRADVSGTVVDASNGMQPVAGATVNVRADPDGPSVVTGADGTFILPLSIGGSVDIAASIAYDAGAAVNYLTNSVNATDPSAGVTIELYRMPAAEDPDYRPPSGSQGCSFCHSQIFDEWQGSVHAGASTDFWVRDLFSGDGSPGGSNGFVYIDTHDPDDSGTCATCHAAMADVFDPGNTFLNEVVDNAEPGQIDGVSCVTCHQIHSVDGDVNDIHLLGNAEYRFPDPTADLPAARWVWGPLDDVDRTFMRASYAPFFRESRFCATCHQYRSPFGQTTYEEWLASPFAVPGEDFRTCQDCHMPQREDAGRICDLGPEIIRPPEERHAHTFIGSTPETLSENIDLETSISSQENGVVNVRAAVTNRGAGHAFPTGVSIRNALLVITAQVDGTELMQVGGPTVPDWADDDVPGKQEGDFAGMAGTGYAKILQGRINGQGEPVTPVLFIDAETVLESSKIESGETRVTEVSFAIPQGAPLGAPLTVEARLLYRRAFRALAVTKQWTETPQGGPIEIEVASVRIDDQVSSTTGPLEIPTLSFGGLTLMAGLLALSGLLLYRRR